VKSLALLAALAGCPSARSGTIDLGLTSAPGSTLLDDVQKLRVTLTSPHEVVEATRGPDGFSLSLEVDADGAIGALLVEGFDAGGAAIAGGQSPLFNVAAVDARIVVYMAAPLSFGRAPLALMPARANVSGSLLSYGVALAGGHDAAGAPSDAIAIYNAYDHSIAGGRMMPAPRDGIVMASTSSNGVVLFGGRDASGAPAGTAWLFDTTVPPSGAYFDLGNYPAFARADETALAIGVDRFIVTGTPPIDLIGAGVQARNDVPALVTGASHLVNGVPVAFALDANGRLQRLRTAAFEPDTLVRPGGTIAILPDGRFIVVGGGTPEEQNDIVVIDPNSGGTSVFPDVLATPRAGASVAVTRRHVLIAGGGAIEVLDATTFARVATGDAIEGDAYALPNDQVLIVDAATADLWLFTPPPGV
jgi:hypothetical protein